MTFNKSDPSQPPDFGISLQQRGTPGVFPSASKDRPLSVPMRIERPEDHQRADDRAGSAFTTIKPHVDVTQVHDIALIDAIRQNPTETVWLEAQDEDMALEPLAKRCSALSNAARISGEEQGYLIWGLESETLVIIGTTFNPDRPLEKGETRIGWLIDHLMPAMPLEFRSIDHPEGRLVLLEIPAAREAPLTFNKIPFVKIGNLTPKLTDYPERYQQVMERLQPYCWEQGIARRHLSAEEVLDLLDHKVYYRLRQWPAPDHTPSIIETLERDRLIVPGHAGSWNITHLGAILLAHRFTDFGESLSRKAIRVVVYEGKNKSTPVLRELEGQKGYALGFEGLISKLMGLSPRRAPDPENPEEPPRLIPETIVREVIANALIHQDMTISGTGPLIEVFKDRIAISNPGLPLVKPDRMVDLPPRSRNAAMAHLMRCLGFCEERGRGLQKALALIEIFEFPPPLFRTDGHATEVTLYRFRPYAEMTAQERTRAAYYHAVMQYLNSHKMKNASLCFRLGIAQRNAAQASLVIQKALDAGLIQVSDPDHPRAGYLPYWA